MVWVVLRNHITLKLTKVVNAPRNIPAALRKKFKETLKEMEEKRVIRKVDEPTDWVNSLVVVKKPKSDKLRVCLAYVVFFCLTPNNNIINVRFYSL
jgi:hypothetical protein